MIHWLQINMFGLETSLVSYTLFSSHHSCGTPGRSQLANKASLLDTQGAKAGNMAGTTVCTGHKFQRIGAHGRLRAASPSSPPHSQPPHPRLYPHHLHDTPPVGHTFFNKHKQSTLHSGGQMSIEAAHLCRTQLCLTPQLEQHHESTNQFNTRLAGLRVL